MLLAVLLVAPAKPLTAGSETPAAPGATITTFNVVRFGLYPTQYNDGLVVDGNRAFLVNSRYDSTIPPDSYGWVGVYNVADPLHPQLVRDDLGSTGQTIGRIAVENGILALPLALHGWESSAGAFDAYDVAGGQKICRTFFDYYVYGMASSVALSTWYAFVGVSSGLAVLGLTPVGGQCVIKTLFPSAAVSDIAKVGTLLYLAQPTGVRVVNVANPLSPSEVGFYPTPHPVSDIAVSTANTVYAGSDYGLDIIDGASGQIVTHFGPNSTVAVAVDSARARAYVGTRDDLQVLDVSDPSAPKLIGAYVDSEMEFERGLAVDGVLVHSSRGIFQYSPELWLEALSPSVTQNGTEVPSGVSVKVNPKDRFVLASPDGKARLKARCSLGSQPRLADMQRARTFVLTPAPPNFQAAWNDVAAMSAYMDAQCGKPLSTASPAADSPALPFSLESGGLELSVLTPLGAIQVDTMNASSRAGGGTRFEAAHAPGLGRSEFVCLAGTLQVQPTAADAPLLTLGPGQFVNVTAAGAGPVGQLRYVYLPLVLR